MIQNAYCHLYAVIQNAYSHLYADDTILLMGGPRQDSLIESLEKELTNIDHWLSINKLTFGGLGIRHITAVFPLLLPATITLKALAIHNLTQTHILTNP